MRIFETKPNHSWTHKLNFVDDNNVFVGFDFSHQCCEDFGYFFVSKKPKLEDLRTIYDSEQELEVPDLEGYTFDPSFCLALERGDLNFAVFKLAKKKHPNLYLVLYNYHNGYYSHGFNFNGTEGTL